MKSKCFSVFVWFGLPFFCFSTQAQNLVANGGFENIKSCPNSWVDVVQKPVALIWYSPDNGTPDYYNTCGTNAAKVPDLWSGYQLSYEGEGFAGIYNWSKFGYKEYLGVKLLQPLIKDTTYIVSFSFANAKNAEYANFDVGLALSEDSLLSEKKQIIIDARIDTNEWNPTIKWAKLEKLYKANGYEKFLFIGNFQSSSTPDTIKFISNYVHPMLNGRAYMYIDEVIIQPLYKTYPMNDPFFIDNIYFEFDKATLSSGSIIELDELAVFLINNKSATLTINGFTDDVGEESYNIRLSQERADAVRLYLIEKDVEPSRVIAQGKGEYTTNDESEEIRSKNRKVEFILKTSD